MDLMLQHSALVAKELPTTSAQRHFKVVANVFLDIRQDPVLHVNGL